ncbi:MAG TPA: MFS transporter [Burkholderiales bacterium]|jgi:UMF1 family MFS transporter|nr:MFS transporter [Burkholderiales bacterium]
MEIRTKRQSLHEDVRPREVWAWAMFDFANSGYTTVVITAVFNAYFVAVVAQGAVWGTFAWTVALSFSYALIVLTAPVLGAYADVHAAKKPLLALSTAGCVLATAGLALVGPGDLTLGIALLVVSNFFYGSGENLIAAFLPEIAKGRALGKVSGWGWGLGYFGGLLTLAACLAYVTWAQAAGQGAAQFVPVTMLITSAVFLLASLPTFVLLRERAVPQAGAERANAFARTWDTVQHARRYQDLMRFLVCILFYQAGVQSVIALAAIYAQEAMGFGSRETILLVLLVNVTAMAGALAFGQFQDKLGHKATIALTLLGWLITIAVAWAAQTRGLFWIAANLAGLCLGASQSAGRALIGYLSPAQRRAEFFGLWGLAVKLSSIFGPLTYGVVSWLSGGDHRRALLTVGVFFIAGLLVLAGIDVRRGRRAARRAQREAFAAD